jgi:uncharacterized protein (DUF433 family)
MLKVINYALTQFILHPRDDVLNWLTEGMSINDIITNFPELNENQVKACLSYVNDKRN